MNERTKKTKNKTSERTNYERKANRGTK